MDGTDDTVDESDDRLARLEARIVALEVEVDDLRVAAVSPAAVGLAPASLAAPPPPPAPSGGPRPGGVEFLAPGQQAPPPSPYPQTPYPPSPHYVPPPPTSPQAAPYPAPYPAQYQAPYPGGQMPTPIGPGAAPRAPRTAPLDTETLLKWCGVVLVVLAVGFAVSSAIRRGWIGPELQLIAAYGVGLGLLGTGYFLIPRSRGWQQALFAGGVFALALTAASNLMIDVTSVDVATVALLVVAAVGFGLAWFVASEWVGATTLVSVMLLSVAVEVHERPVGAYLVWGALVVAGALVLAEDRTWPSIRVGAMAAGLVWFVGGVSLASTDAEMIAALVAAAILGVLVWWLPGRSEDDLDNPWRQIEVQVVSVLAPWTLLVVLLAFDVDADASVWAYAFVIGAGSAALAVGSATFVPRVHLVSQVLGASVVLSIGFANLLDTRQTMLAFAVQGVGLLTLRRLLPGRSIRLLGMAGLLLSIAALTSWAAMIEAWSDDLAIGYDIGNLAIIALVASVGFFFEGRPTRRVVGGGCLVMVLTWLGSVFVHAPQGQAIVSVTWAALGITMLVIGAMWRQPDVATVGLGVIGLTVAKLLSVDLAEVDTLWRAGLFLVVGVGLLRLGYLMPRLMRSDETPPDGTPDNAAGTGI